MFNRRFTDIMSSVYMDNNIKKAIRKELTEYVGLRTEIGAIKSRLDVIEQRIDTIEKRIKKLEKSLNKMATVL